MMAKKKKASARRYMQSPRAAKRFRSPGSAKQPPSAGSKSILSAYD